MSEKLIQFLKEYEHFVGQRYGDLGKGKGKPTIGYGHLITKRDTVSALSELGADLLLRSDLKFYEDAVNRQITAPLSQNEFDALVALTFNIGPGGKNISEGLYESGIRQKINSYQPVSEADFTKYNKSGGQVLDGLIDRHRSEFLIYATDTYRRYW